jgi:hypothetical protein
MQGYQCGQLWGAALAAGAQAYRLFGPGPQAEAAAVIATQRIVESFRDRNKEINCLELTGIDLNTAKKQPLRTFIKMLIGGKVIRCFSMAATCAQMSFREINAALSQKPIEGLSHPASCAAMLAQKMGVSDMHAVMAAGFAGGIGLSGGACGALGAAIWILAMENGKEGLKFDNERASAVMDRFVESADYEFECSKIVGKKFENVNDHAGYLRDGGCSNIIEALARNGTP